MNMEAPTFQERIFDLAYGTLDPKKCYLPESQFVVNEFSRGMPCTLAYQEMLDAYSRLCMRLGAEEWNDPDVEAIISPLLFLVRHLSLKMFSYGVFFARRGSEGL